MPFNTKACTAYIKYTLQPDSLRPNQPIPEFDLDYVSADNLGEFVRLKQVLAAELPFKRYPKEIYELEPKSMKIPLTISNDPLPKDIWNHINSYLDYASSSRARRTGTFLKNLNRVNHTYFYNPPEGNGFVLTDGNITNRWYHPN